MTFRWANIWNSDSLVFYAYMRQLVNTTTLIDMIKVIVLAVVIVVYDYFINDIIMSMVILVINYFITHSDIIVYIFIKINNYKNIYSHSVSHRCQYNQ